MTEIITLYLFHFCSFLLLIFSPFSTSFFYLHFIRFFPSFIRPVALSEFLFTFSFLIFSFSHFLFIFLSHLCFYFLFSSSYSHFILRVLSFPSFPPTFYPFNLSSNASQSHVRIEGQSGNRSLYGAPRVPLGAYILGHGLAVTKECERKMLSLFQLQR
jgi:hypothetical protein